MKRCSNCISSWAPPPDYHEPFCEFGGDISGDGKYAEECEQYKECTCIACLSKNELERGLR